MIVLGAGASIGANSYTKERRWRSGLRMPSSQNFFYDIFDYRKNNRKSDRFLNALGLTYESVNNFLVQAWGLKNNVNQFDPMEWRDVNIEDVYTFLDVGEKMFNKGTSYHIAFSRSKKYLEEFITDHLSIRTDGRHCEYLSRLFGSLQPQDSIISFNWDTLADYSLMRLNAPQFSTYLSMMSGYPIHTQTFVKKGGLLKLHGSLNWIVCDNKKCEAYLNPQIPLRKGSKKLQHLISTGSDICNICGCKSTKPFIVPPTSDKLIHKYSFLHRLWLIARENLSNADRIVFIGYSFPPTDFYVEWLFRQIYFLENKQPEIVVVNPEIFKKNSLVSRRYNTIFRNYKIVRYKTLKEYASEIHDIPTEQMTP